MSTSPRRGRTARETPVRTHWVLLVTMVMTLTLTLLIEGYTQHMFGFQDDGGDPPQGPVDQVPPSVENGGPVISSGGSTPVSLTPPSRTVLLTFDDGPDPTWTPKVLATLEKHHVPATFFLVGTGVATHPELVARMAKDGDELGLHSFTHPYLPSLPSWQRTLEMREDQLAVAGASGITSNLFRPPYSSSADAVGNADWAAMRQLGKQGYLTVLVTQDSEDWQKPGVQRIVRNATPAGTTGQVILFHDAGGDRSQTVAALNTLIPQLKARGYRFETVSRAFRLTGANRPASTGQQLLGVGLLWLLKGALWGLNGLGALLLVAGVLSIVRAVISMAAAARHRRHARTEWGPPVTEPVSVIVPAYNESAGIEATVRSLAASDHLLEIIVVDDGSTDGTADIVEALGLPGVRVIRQRNAGKPAALNTGIAAASYEIVVMMDGDTVFEPDAVRQLVQPFSDPRIGAVSGNAKVVNRGGLLGRWQHIEYVVGFNLDRRLFDLAECMPTVPGAIGAWRRAALVRVGGVSEATLAEDTDLTMAIWRDGWRVVYEEKAVAWTEAPASLGALWRQRYRWCYGTLQAMWKHRRAVRQSGAAGRFGRRGLLFLLFFQVLLPLFAPLVDVLSLYGVIFLDPVHVLLLWFSFLLIQFITGAYAFRLDGERLGPLWSLPFQQFVYRQLMYLVVVQSVATALSGSRLRWQRMERYGSHQEPPLSPATGAQS
ncbi:bifunctional polysaccharide deacetylase/glycosyltransferase family 2 protein [Streptomyces sp. CG1]|uniref:bifunctional polysaccharide deacetylase/glycosyltransferase family 2 protein n=1 Tax=Streptomyces sp. CG1 TaxID=1287523 RepID=UPI0034E265E7